MGDSKETHIQHTFDSFCKKIVYNEALNVQRKYARFRQRQISMEILEQKGLDAEFYYLEPNLNSSGTSIVLGMKIFISNEELTNAIAALPSQRQKIIFTSFLIGLDDHEIGDIIGKSLGSAWYQRQMVLEESGKYLGVKYEAK